MISVLFDPKDPKGIDQKVLNLFYLCCYAHDFFYLLNFRELDGNFQMNNFGRGGLAGDAVSARVFDMRVSGTAHMDSQVDGFAPIMRVGSVSQKNGPPRHCALDADVIIHEYTHGVTTLLVGGRIDPTALESPQSRGMGEGWSDYIACVLTKKNVVGSWVVDDPAGIRNFPYDSDYPLHFGHLGQLVTKKGITVDLRPSDPITRRRFEEHNIGEIWCATLLELNREIGEKLAVQLVIDALKLSPTNPSFLDERDAILEALDDMLSAGKMSKQDNEKNKSTIWKVFTKFRMGPNAKSFGAQLSGIVPDPNIPDPT